MAVQSTLGQLQAVILSALGRSDSVATALATAMVNYAVTIVALVFRPPELRQVNTVTYIGNTPYLNISGLDWIDITRIWNTTDNRELRFIPFSRLDVVIPATLTLTKYYSLFGDLLYLRLSPIVNKSLSVSALVMPDPLVNVADVVPFDTYDSYLVSMATTLCQAALEEGEAAMMWQKIADGIVQPFMLGTKERDILDGQSAYIDTLVGQQQQGGG